MSDDLVHRLSRALLEALRRRGDARGRPLTIGELHQDLLPYPAVRSALGVDLNADYEHALLRLVAGEGGILRVESEQAREELQREADAVVPAVGLFRKFAAYEVQLLVPVDVARGRAPDDGVPDAATQEDATPEEPGEGDDREESAEQSEADEEVESAPGPAERSAWGSGAASLRIHRGRPPGNTEGVPPCFFCAEELPSDRAVNFCPACGGDQRSRACTHCETPLERGWRFCITCGHPTAAL